MKILYISDTDYTVDTNMQRFQQMARALSKTHEVEYIFPTDGKKTRQISPTLKVLGQHPNENRKYISTQNYDVCIIDWAFLGNNIPSDFDVPILYGIVDDHDLSKKYYDAKEWDANHKHLMSTAEVVFATSNPLISKYGSERSDMVLSRNGVCFEDWEIKRKNIEINNYYLKLRKQYKKIVGYFGCISWWLDLESIYEAATELKDTAFVFMGHHCQSTQQTKTFTKNYSNLYDLGVQNYYDLKHHLYNWDVATVPFKLCPITHAVSPVKMFEYFAMGKPVVSSRMNEVKEYDTLYWYDENKKFVDAIKEAFKQTNEEKLKNIEIAKQNTWDSRSNKLLLELKKKEKTPESILTSRMLKKELEDGVSYTLEKSNSKAIKQCIITLVDSEFTKKANYFFDLTHKTFISYADKYNLDYEVLVGKPNQSFTELMYEKFRIKSRFKKYDQILFIDADVLIQNHATNIFDELKENNLAMFMESDVTPPEPFMIPWVNEYNSYLKTIGKKEEYNIKDWDGSYYNAGTMVINKKLEYLFEEPKKRIFNHCAEQGLINYYIQRDKIPVSDLTKKWSGWFVKDVENEESYDLLKQCNFIHFPGKNKTLRIKKYLHFVNETKNEKLLKSDPKVIWSKANKNGKYSYSEDYNKILSKSKSSQSYRDLKTSSKTCKGLIELINYLPGGIMVEVGSNIGESSELFAKKFKKVDCVDHFENKAIHVEFSNNMAKIPNINKVKGWSHRKVSEYKDNSLDFVYLDANTNYEFACSDITLWWQKIKLGGYIGGHNYVRQNKGYNLIQAIQERFGNPDILFDDTSWLIKKENQFIPKVSVIIPLYNQGKYLEECLNSLVNQTYKNFEVIIIDDKSTDDSAKIMSDLAFNLNKEKSLFISTIYQSENKGPGATRNKGILMAVGEYILPLDADNTLTPNAIEVFQKELDKNTGDIIYCRRQNFGEKFDVWNNIPYSLDQLKKNNIIENTAMFRRLHWWEVGKYDENKNVGFEDWEFWLRMAFFKNPFRKLNDILINYRVHSDSLFFQHNKERLKHITHIKKKLKF